MGIARNMDAENSGLVNWRQFLTYLTLGYSPLPTVKKLAEAKESCGGQEWVNKAGFVAGAWWFDEFEQSKDRPYSNPFDRASMIKEVLFDINATKQPDGEYLLNIDALTEMLRIPYRRCNSAKVFSDFLFAPVKPITI